MATRKKSKQLNKRNLHAKKNIKRLVSYSKKRKVTSKSRKRGSIFRTATLAKQKKHTQKLKKPLVKLKKDQRKNTLKKVIRIASGAAKKGKKQKQIIVSRKHSVSTRKTLEIKKLLAAKKKLKEKLKKTTQKLKTVRSWGIPRKIIIEAKKKREIRKEQSKRIKFERTKEKIIREFAEAAKPKSEEQIIREYVIRKEEEAKEKVKKWKIEHGRDEFASMEPDPTIASEIAEDTGLEVREIYTLFFSP